MLRGYKKFLNFFNKGVKCKKKLPIYEVTEVQQGCCMNYKSSWMKDVNGLTEEKGE